MTTLHSETTSTLKKSIIIRVVDKDRSGVHLDYVAITGTKDELLRQISDFRFNYKEDAQNALDEVYGVEP